MTCIVGIVDDNTVYIGGDSAGIAGNNICIRADEKVFKNGPYLIGFTSSFRMGQLLRFDLEPPKPPDNSNKLFEFMVKEFVPATRECFKKGGFSTIRNSEEQGGQFLIGVNGHLFSMEQDYQIGEFTDNCASVGSGMQIAQGALFATKDKSPRTRIKIALEASAKYCTGVVGPFVIKSMKG